MKTKSSIWALTARNVAYLVAIAGGLVLWLSTTIEGTPSAFAGQLGSLPFVAAGGTVLWDWKGRRALAGEVWEMARLTEDLKRMGIKSSTSQYLADIDWEHLFRNAKVIDINFAYGSTWRNTNHGRLEEAVKRRVRLRVILPDLDDADTMNRLSQRFGMTPDDLKLRIHDAIKTFTELSKLPSADVQVRYRSGDPLFSSYRFDNCAVLTLYTHSRNRRFVPTFLCESTGDDSSLWGFVYGEFKSMFDESREGPQKEAS